MEAINQSGQPRNSGKRGPMWPAPLTSGGLALEEITCRGWGPHLQYSFLIKLASLSGSGVRRKLWAQRIQNKCSFVKRKPLGSGNEARGKSPVHPSFPPKAENGRSSRSSPTFWRKIVTVHAIPARFLKFLYRLVA